MAWIPRFRTPESSETSPAADWLWGDRCLFLGGRSAYAALPKVDPAENAEEEHLDLDSEGLILVLNDLPFDLVDETSITSGATAHLLGTLTVAREDLTSAAGDNRFVAAGGHAAGHVSVIDWTTAASVGSFSAFGSLTAARSGLAGTCWGDTALFLGGRNDSGVSSAADRIALATTSDAASAGSLTAGLTDCAGASHPDAGFLVGGSDTTDCIGARASIGRFSWSVLISASPFASLSETRTALSAVTSRTRVFALGGITKHFAALASTEAVGALTGGLSVFFSELSSVHRSGAAASNETAAAITRGLTGSAGTMALIERLSLYALSRSHFFGALSQGRARLTASCWNGPCLIVAVADSGGTAELWGDTGVLSSGTGAAVPIFYLDALQDSFSVEPEEEPLDRVPFRSSCSVSVMQRINLQNRTTDADFGALDARRSCAALSDRTVGLFAGGYLESCTVLNTVRKVTIAMPADAQAFGTLAEPRFGQAGCDGETAGLLAGGTDAGGHSNTTCTRVLFADGTMTSGFATLSRPTAAAAGGAGYHRQLVLGGWSERDTATISSMSVVTPDTGACAVADARMATGLSSAATACTHMRTVVAGGCPGSGGNVDRMQYVGLTLAAEFLDFGALSVTRSAHAGLSNGYRGVFAGGSTASGLLATMEEISMAAPANAAHFGSLTRLTGQVSGFTGR